MRDASASKAYLLVHGNHHEAESLPREAFQIRHAAFGAHPPDHAETLRVLEAEKQPLQVYLSGPSGGFFAAL